jgi:hypothetical protein
MPTLAEQRASMRDNLSATFDGGNRAAKERRAIGDRLVRERTGKDVSEDLQRLAAPVRAAKRLRTVESRGALQPQRGYADNPPKELPATGGGVASPFTEPSYAAREFWAGGLPSSDGLLILPATKKVVMADADDAEVIFNYAEPV